jgi:uncharacterized membrane protein
MDILQKKLNNSSVLWILTSIALLIGFFFAFVGFAEFFNVAIAGETRRYNYQSCWWPTNELPWYYQNSNTLSSYKLISGSLFFIVTILTLCARIQKKKTLTIIGVSFIILLAIAELISSNIS